MTKKKMKAKGFTLVELIVAIAVFMIMALVLASAITFTSNLVYSSQNITKKVNNQSSYGIDTAVAPPDPTTTSDTVKISISGKDVEIYVDLIEVEGASAGSGEADYDSAPNRKYMVVK